MRFNFLKLVSVAFIAMLGACNSSDIAGADSQEIEQSAAKQSALALTVASTAPTYRYTITVKTGNVSGAGTDAHITASIYGSKSQLLSLNLDNPGNDNERNAADTYTFYGNDIGTINSLYIIQDNSGSHPGWYVDWITVEKYNLSTLVQTKYFSVNRWFASSSAPFTTYGWFN